MLSNPPSTGDAKLDNFLKSVKRHIDDALRPADGWRLSDFSADVSEVISDKRDLIDIVTAYDDITALRDSVDLVLADYAEVIADFKAIGKQYEDHAEVFSHTMEWWNQNRKIIEDAAEAMAATLLASDYADAAEASALRAGNYEEAFAQARDDAVTAKNEAQTTATQVADQVEAAATHAGNAQTSAANAKTSETNAKTSETRAKTSETNAKTSETNAEAAAASAEADRVVVEQAATSASWSGDRLTVLGATSPSLKGDKGDKGDPGEKGDPGDGSGDVLWSELNPVLDGKAPVSHDHTIGEVAGLEDALAAAGTAEHTHPQSDVEGLEDALAGKASANHTHTASDVGAAPVSHTHTVSQVTGLQSALDGKAAADHQHDWDDVAGKPTVYPPETHTHTASQISDATATGRSVLTASSQSAARQAIGAGTSNLVLGTTSSTAAAGNHTHSQYATTAQVEAKADKTHTHTIEEVDGLDVALDNAGGPPVIVSTTPPEDTDAIWVNPSEEPPPNDHPEYATSETVNARPATWLWDGVEPWVPPDAAVAGDVVLNLSTGAITTAVLP